MNGDDQAHEIRTLSDLAGVLARAKRPVLLVEGIRALPDGDRGAVVAMGRMLAMRLPQAVFRSGNAEGADSAFAEGVCAVDPGRMEYVLPSESMGRTRRHPGGRVVALDQLPRTAAGPIGEYTAKASPELKGLVRAYRSRGRRGPLGGKALYVLRDTLKVVGALRAGLAPATAGIFYVNEADPMAGGTGHTIRVCRERKVPVVVQGVWRGWLA
jgi:hypothetical protein